MGTVSDTKGAADAQAAEAAQITLNAFNIAVNGGLSAGNMIDGVVDTFTDATGTDTRVIQPVKAAGKYTLTGSTFALTTADFTALAAPDSALVFLHENPAASITLNTDLQAWVSRTTSKKFTTDGGTDNKITVTAHGWSNGQQVLLSETNAGIIPAALDTNIAYFIVNATTNDFELSLTSGGSAIAFSAATNDGSSIANGKYSGNSFSVSSQETAPSGLAFSSNGLKFYVVGAISDTVYEYTCSVAYDMGSTVAATGESFSVASQETQPAALVFNPAGTKFFVVGLANDTVYEYTCSVGFDLSSTVAYSGNSFDVSSQNGQPYGLAFNPDGTKFFIAGSHPNDAIYEYTCSVGFDLSSTVAYSSNSFSLSSQMTQPRTIAFNSAGTVFFVLGRTNKIIYQYTSSVGFDLSSTVAYSGNNLSVNSEETFPNGFYFKPDLSKFFVIGQTSDSVFEYDFDPAGYTSVYSQATLALDGEQSTGSIVSGSADLSGQVSGTAIHTAIITPTETVIDLLALSTQWS